MIFTFLDLGMQRTVHFPMFISCCLLHVLNLMYVSCIEDRFLLCRELKSITDREVCCFMISCKNSTNIDTVIDWLVKHSKTKNWAVLLVFNIWQCTISQECELSTFFEVTFSACLVGFVNIWPPSSVMCFVQTKYLLLWLTYGSLLHPCLKLIVGHYDFEFHV